MWSGVLLDLDWRVTANCTSKLQTRPLVREGAPQHEDRKCPTVKIWSDTKTGWSTARRSRSNLNVSSMEPWNGQQLKESSRRVQSVL
jgi:hypothetical protein